MILEQWAIKHSVNITALTELKQIMGIDHKHHTQLETGNGSEAKAQGEVRIEASQKGARLWRNNVGSTKSKIPIKCRSCGQMNYHIQQPVRYGLCNETKALNEKVKSSDLIGLRPIIITPEMTGLTVALFMAREIKPYGWSYSGTNHEKAQLSFINLVLSMGGDACFATGAGSIK